MSATADLAVARSVIRKVFDGRYVDTTGVADLVTRGASVQLGEMNWVDLSPDELEAVLDAFRHAPKEDP